MLIQRAYKTELDPTPEQVDFLRLHSDVTRKAYNWALGKWNEVWDRNKGVPDEEREKLPSFGSLIAEFRAVRAKEFPWALGVASRCEESAIRVSLKGGFERFFKMCKGEIPRPPFRPRKDLKPNGYPRFRSRHRGTMPFCFWSIKPEHVQRGRIRLQKIGWLKLKEKGYLPTVEGSVKKINRATVSERAGHWFVSLQVEEEIPDRRPAAAPVGVDLGLSNLATVSDGESVEYYDNPQALRKLERKLRKLMKEFGRRHCRPGQANHMQKKRGGIPCSYNVKKRDEPMSANARRTQEKIQRLHYRIACIRQDAAHQASHRIIEHWDPETVVVEDLNVAGMMKNTRLAKAIADAGMAEVKRQITYKAEWNGAQVVVADRWFASTKGCPECGNVKEVMRLDERTYHCAECGFTAERDHSACLSLLKEYVAGKPPDTQNACGEAGSRLAP